MQEVREDLAYKEKILSIMIKKKQSRFTKVPGTQILKVNDPYEAAKIYLGTADHRKTEIREARRTSTYCIDQ